MLGAKWSARKFTGDSPAIGPQPNHRAAPSTQTLSIPIPTPTLSVGTEECIPLIIVQEIGEGK
ncbi:hypothetical protein YC2023_061250 [Brassica napus]